MAQGCVPFLVSYFYPTSVSGFSGPRLSQDLVNLHNDRRRQVLFYRWGNRGPDRLSDLPKATQCSAELRAGGAVGLATVRLATGGAAWAWGRLAMSTLLPRSPVPCPFPASTGVSLTAQPLLPAPRLPLGVWEETQEERGGKEGDSRRCVGWGGASAWGALRRQTQEQLGLVRAGARWEEAC